MLGLLSAPISALEGFRLHVWPTVPTYLTSEKYKPHIWPIHLQQPLPATGAPPKAPVSQVATKPTSEGMPINQFKPLHDMMAER